MSAGSSALRRRRKPSLASRLKIAWVFIVISVAVAAYAGYTLVTLPQLRVHEIDVSVDGLAVSQRDVLAAANIDRRDNAWLLNTGAIARRIEAIPYVARAEVVRTLPARVAIAVTEREPAACVRGGGRIVTIDASRRILQAGCARPSAVGIAVPDGSFGPPGSYASMPVLALLLDDSRVLTDAGIAVHAIAADRYGGIVAVDTNGVRLLFGSAGDLREKAKLVAPVIAATRGGRPIRAIDLRAPATPTVQF